MMIKPPIHDAEATGEGKIEANDSQSCFEKLGPKHIFYNQESLDLFKHSRGKIPKNPSYLTN